MKAKDIINYHKKAQPDKTAIIYKGKTISYKELDTKINNFTAELKNLGVRKGDNVTLLMSDHPDFIISFFAILKLEAVVFPFNPKESIDAIKQSLNDAKAAFLITNKSIIKYSGDYLKKTIQLKDGKIEDFKEFSGYKSNSIKNSGNIYRIYTSGSTGKPKHILYNETDFPYLMSQLKILEIDDVVIGTTPLYHAYGLHRTMLMSLFVGCTLVIAENYFPQFISKLIKKHKVTVFFTVPVMLKLVIDSQLNADFRTLRFVLCCSGLLSDEYLQNFRANYDVPVYYAYGSTEAGMISINYDVKVGQISVGKATPGTAVKIFKNGKECKPRAIGDIGVKNALTNKDHSGDFQNKLVFCNNFFLQEDKGYKDDKGDLYVIGRDYTAFIRGKKINFFEVEKTLRQCNKIDDVFVYANNKIMAAIVKRKNIKEKDVEDYCKQRLLHYQVPFKVVFLPVLPRNQMGKLIKDEVKKIIEDDN